MARKAKGGASRTKKSKAWTKKYTAPPKKKKKRKLEAIGYSQGFIHGDDR